MGSRSFHTIYDAAGRLAAVTNAAGTHEYAYGASNQRLQLAEQGAGGGTTLYAWGGGSVLAEYNGAGGGMAWTKSYVYLGGRLLATDSTGGVQYHHPDRLGTRLVTNALGGVVSENVGLPFGNLIGAESTTPEASASKRRFTSYDRSEVTKLDYAVNRHYSAAQGRFTQVDPIGMNAADIGDPQSLNLYAYCANDSINWVDPTGLELLTAIAVGFVIGGVIGFGASVLSQGIDNYLRGKRVTDINWKAAGVAAVTGAVAGALAPVVATGVVGAAVLGGGSNAIQYYLTKKVNGEQPSLLGVAISGGVGALAGPVTSRFARIEPFEENVLPYVARNATVQGIFRDLNDRYSLAANVAAMSLIRSASVTTLTNLFPTERPGGSNATQLPGVTPSPVNPSGSGEMGNRVRMPLPRASGRIGYSWTSLDVLHLSSYGSGRSQNLGCYSYDGYKVCVTFTKTGK